MIDFVAWEQLLNKMKGLSQISQIGYTKRTMWRQTRGMFHGHQMPLQLKENFIEWSLNATSITYLLCCMDLHIELQQNEKYMSPGRYVKDEWSYKKISNYDWIHKNKIKGDPNKRENIIN